MPYVFNEKLSHYGQEELELIKSYVDSDNLYKGIEYIIDELRDQPFGWVEIFMKKVIGKKLPRQTLYICYDYSVKKEHYEECQILLRAIKYWEGAGDNDVD